jgi:MFS family permease
VSKKANTKTLLTLSIDKLTQFNWIVTAFTLAATSTMLLYGQLADVFGRHVMIQASIFFVLIGSVLGAGAQDWSMLLLGRAFQGLGFAGLGIVSRIVLSDKVSLKEASLNNTIFMWLNGVSMGVGPLIGGYLTKVCPKLQYYNCLANFSGFLEVVLHHQCANRCF